MLHTTHVCFVLRFTPVTTDTRIRQSSPVFNILRDVLVPLPAAAALHPPTLTILLKAYYGSRGKTVQAAPATLALLHALSLLNKTISMTGCSQMLTMFNHSTTKEVLVCVGKEFYIWVQGQSLTMSILHQRLCIILGPVSGLCLLIA